MQSFSFKRICNQGIAKHRAVCPTTNFTFQCQGSIMLPTVQNQTGNKVHAKRVQWGLVETINAILQGGKTKAYFAANKGHQSTSLSLGDCGQALAVIRNGRNTEHYKH